MKILKIFTCLFNLQVWVTIGMSSSGLTKICTVTPIYMFRNTSDVKMWIAEATGQVNWILIRPKSVNWETSTSK